MPLKKKLKCVSCKVKTHSFTTAYTLKLGGFFLNFLQNYLANSEDLFSCRTTFSWCEVIVAQWVSRQQASWVKSAHPLSPLLSNRVGCVSERSSDCSIYLPWLPHALSFTLSLVSIFSFFYFPSLLYQNQHPWFKNKGRKQIHKLGYLPPYNFLFDQPSDQ